MLAKAEKGGEAGAKESKKKDKTKSVGISRTNAFKAWTCDLQWVRMAWAMGRAQAHA